MPPCRCLSVFPRFTLDIGSTPFRQCFYADSTFPLRSFYIFSTKPRHDLDRASTKFRGEFDLRMGKRAVFQGRARARRSSIFFSLVIPLLFIPPKTKYSLPLEGGGQGGGVLKRGAERMCASARALSSARRKATSLRPRNARNGRRRSKGRFS